MSLKKTLRWLGLNAALVAVTGIAGTAAERLGRKWFGKPKDEKKAERKLRKKVEDQEALISDMSEKLQRVAEAHDALVKLYLKKVADDEKARRMPNIDYILPSQLREE